MADDSITGKRALVTGASRGIGRSTALALAQAGVDVALAARGSEELGQVAAEIAALGRKTAVIPCDVTDAAQVQRMVDDARAQLGGIDILVNNAGSAQSAKFLSHPDELWHRMLAMNLTSVYYRHQSGSARNGGATLGAHHHRRLGRRKSGQSLYRRIYRLQAWCAGADERCGAGTGDDGCHRQRGLPWLCGYADDRCGSREYDQPYRHERGRGARLSREYQPTAAARHAGRGGARRRVPGAGGQRWHHWSGDQRRWRLGDGVERTRKGCWRWTTTFVYEVDDGVATITLNRPEKLNALTFEIYAQLRDLFEALRYDDAVKVVVLTGAGDAFSSGGDVQEIIGELLKRDMKGHLDFTRMTGAVVQHMRMLDKPILAALNGMTAGAGTVLALASDLRIASEQARIAFLFTRVGLTGADMGAGYLLPRIVGLGRAFELLLLGDTIDAPTAERYGLVNRVVPHDEVMSTTMGWARRLAAWPNAGAGDDQTHAQQRIGHGPGLGHRGRGAGAGVALVGRRSPRLL